MAVNRQHRVRLALSALLLITGLFYCAVTDYGLPENGIEKPAARVLDAPGISLFLGRGSLRLDATTASAEHEAGLRKLLAEHFDDHGAETVFRPGIRLPPHWETLSNRLLYATAMLESARATMRPERIQLHGITSNEVAFRQRLDFLRSAAPDTVAIDSDVRVATDTASLADLCQRSFASVASEAINFHQSSTEIRTSSLPMLDRLIEFAYSCKDRRIAITGHSDAIGSEDWNLRISRGRAQAVADYLVSGGIPEARLVVAGRGSAEPVADNETVHGRLQNRRIELDLR